MILLQKIWLAHLWNGELDTNILKSQINVETPPTLERGPPEPHSSLRADSGAPSARPVFSVISLKVPTYVVD